MAAPGDQRFLRVVVARIIVHRHLDLESGVLIPEVFLFQGFRVILAVAHDENLPAVFRDGGIDAGLFRGGQDLQRAGFNNSYEPPKYDYNYYLTPAKSWASFGELTINVNTTAYMLNSSIDGFEKVDTGYRLVRNGLPNEDLSFTLCEDEKPKKEVNWGYYLIIIIPISILVVLVAIIVTIVVVVKKKRKKKNMNKKD